MASFAVGLLSFSFGRQRSALIAWGWGIRVAGALHSRGPLRWREPLPGAAPLLQMPLRYLSITPDLMDATSLADVMGSQWSACAPVRSTRHPWEGPSVTANPWQRKPLPDRLQVYDTARPKAACGSDTGGIGVRPARATRRPWQMGRKSPPFFDLRSDIPYKLTRRMLWGYRVG